MPEASDRRALQELAQALRSVVDERATAPGEPPGSGRLATMPDIVPLPVGRRVWPLLLPGEDKMPGLLVDLNLGADAARVGAVLGALQDAGLERIVAFDRPLPMPPRGWGCTIWREQVFVSAGFGADGQMRKLLFDQLALPDHWYSYVRQHAQALLGVALLVGSVGAQPVDLASALLEHMSAGQVVGTTLIAVPA